ncbi:transmembrane protein 51a [Sphaeramia orbicularis]|uniref:Transmembrane protein 51-like n=1 Tax=Sphaeramia orbicularis TaxID=375764 RepID=A0A673AQV3_9TELE|nr:transmembrane protein 51-like [Sphaeramia orbicularis]XP_029995652.1 transmembrane protein 51-like [Sphaeramia orbicularis]XP_029995653.1 transmembrane protein 51-like [Sphaeramia orbicularis]
MRSGVDGQPSHGREATPTNINTTTNNNSGRNSGSQYALCALGVGLIALGIVMIVWSVVPADAAGNSSSSGSGGGESDIVRKSKASSVAFVLVGAGVVMLLLSMCLGMRNKQRELQMLQVEQNNRAAAAEQQERATAEEEAQRYAVPSYEEAVGSGQYPVRQSNLRPSVSQLPSYDDLVQVDGVQYESEGSAAAAAQPPPGSTAPSASASNRRPGKNSRKLLPIKIRRIKSEKLRSKNADVPQPAAGISIEPLTPPPQYEDKVPPL